MLQINKNGTLAYNVPYINCKHSNLICFGQNIHDHITMP